VAILPAAEATRQKLGLLMAGVSVAEAEAAGQAPAPVEENPAL